MPRDENPRVSDYEWIHENITSRINILAIANIHQEIML